MNTTKRYLIFQKPRTSRCWTQTINAGANNCGGFITKEQADLCAREQNDTFPEWETIVREVELPKEG